MSAHYDRLVVTAYNKKADMPFSKTAQFAQADLEAYRDKVAIHFERVVELAERALTRKLTDAERKDALNKLQSIKEEVGL